jgi:phytoene dehydrogenase-like protein
MAKTESRDFDAIVVGSGPNGLAAAIVLQYHGLSVLLVEARETIGGGLRTAEVTLPGFRHDICSAIHPMAVSSPFFSKLPLREHGLEFIQPTHVAAHPFDDGSAALLDFSLDKTSETLVKDSNTYRNLLRPFIDGFDDLIKDTLGPLRFPTNPLLLSKFGLKALLPATRIAKMFEGKRAKGLWAGMAGHSILPFDKMATSAIGLLLMAAGHTKGWPVAKGGSVSIANALAAYFISLGGKIQTNLLVRSLQDLPSSRALLFDVTPKQLLQIAGHKFSSLYSKQLNRYRYGMGVFKIDWALDGPVPFDTGVCREAGTVHIGNTFEEIAQSEYDTWHGKHSDKPFVLLAQQSLFDSTRAPRGKHSLWGYCHVPNGSSQDMTEAIERQIERFAPGFRDRILDRHTMNALDMQRYNPNYVGGDIIGGAATLDQIFSRPALRFSPYRTSTKGLYLCSSSTPPGGGVHGMCGYYSAQRVLKDIFKIDNIKL